MVIQSPWVNILDVRIGHLIDYQASKLEDDSPVITVNCLAEVKTVPVGRRQERHAIGALIRMELNNLACELTYGRFDLKLRFFEEQIPAETKAAVRQMHQVVVEAVKESNQLRPQKRRAEHQIDMLDRYPEAQNSPS